MDINIREVFAERREIDVPKLHSNQVVSMQAIEMNGLYEHGHGDVVDSMLIIFFRFECYAFRYERRVNAEDVDLSGDVKTIDSFAMTRAEQVRIAIDHADAWFAECEQRLLKVSGKLEADG